MMNIYHSRSSYNVTFTIQVSNLSVVYNGRNEIEFYQILFLKIKYLKLNIEISKM